MFIYIKMIMTFIFDILKFLRCQDVQISRFQDVQDANMLKFLDFQ